MSARHRPQESSRELGTLEEATKRKLFNVGNIRVGQLWSDTASVATTRAPLRPERGIVFPSTVAYLTTAQALTAPPINQRFTVALSSVRDRMCRLGIEPVGGDCSLT
jgi:hypothetical protein